MSGRHAALAAPRVECTLGPPDEIEQASAQINTDAYAMSLGEIINLYRDGELVIRPAFQRLFRWSAYYSTFVILGGGKR